MVLSLRRGVFAGMLFYATLTAGSTVSFCLSLIKKTIVLSAVMNVINSLKGEGKGYTADCVFCVRLMYGRKYWSGNVVIKSCRVARLLANFSN